MTDPLDLRISDADREAAAAELGEHYAQGRLDADEHAERLDRVWAARTRRELDPVFVDLRPTPTYSVPWATATQAQTQRPRRRRRMPFPLLVVVAALVAITVVTHLPLILIGLVAWLVIRSGPGRCGGSRGASGLHHRHRPASVVR